MWPIYSLFVLWILCWRPSQAGEHPDGASQVSRTQDALGNYHFRYSVENGEGEQFRQEGTDAEGRVVGSYGLKHIDGTQRVVDYVADKDGFRAQVRSNEPGVAPIQDAPVLQSGGFDPSPLIPAAGYRDQAQSNDQFPVALSPDVSHSREGHSLSGFGSEYSPPILPGVSSVLSVAATHNRPLGNRPDSSSVEYISEDETPKESRLRDLDDYRPRNPVAYYPGQAPREPEDIPRRGRLLPVPESDLEVYVPPIDPHSIHRRPSPFSPGNRDNGNGFRTTTSSRKPFIPPYGGFDDDDDELPANRRPDPNDGIFSRPTPSYGSDRYPLEDSDPQDRFPAPYPGRGPPPDSRIKARFPRPSIYPGGGNLHPPDSDIKSVYPVPPSYPRNSGLLPPESDIKTIYPEPPAYPRAPPPAHMPTVFLPPSVAGGRQKIVLRAVPIPNGIQAVRVDPETGRVYERLMYPMFIRHDGSPVYDRNILLHDDNEYDPEERFGAPSRPFVRGVRDRPDVDSNIKHNNSSNLNEPTAKDLAWLHQQLASLPGYDANGYEGRFTSDDIMHRFPSEYRFGSDTFDEEGGPSESGSRAASDYPRGSRYPNERLDVNDSESVSSLKLPEKSVEAEQKTVEKTS